MKKIFKTDHKKRKNRKELNSFQENIEGLDSSDLSPENLKLTNDNQEISKNDQIMNINNPGLKDHIVRQSNPATFSSRPSHMTEIDKITESPEYKNSKTLFLKNNVKDNELDEYNIFDSPKISKTKKRGLIVNASGSKKSITAFNKISDSLSNTVRVYFDKQNHELYSDRSHYGNSSSFKDKLNKKQMITNTGNFNHRITVSKNANKTQRMHTDTLGMSPPKKGISLVPIRSKQSETPDSFDRENTGDDVHADIIPDARRKKNKRNIAKDFNTNSRGPFLSKHFDFDEIDAEHDRIQNPFISPQRTTIPIDFMKKSEFIKTPFDVNLSSDDEEYSSEEKFTFRKPQGINLDERNQLSDTFDSIGAMRKKNTPLKSISTKTKESLSTNHKDLTPNKSFEGIRYGRYETLLTKKVYRPYKQDSPAIAT